MAVFACAACGLAIETLSPANSASLFDPRCAECGGELEAIEPEPPAVSHVARHDAAPRQRGI